jgi:hypothetical protein
LLTFSKGFDPSPFRFFRCQSPVQLHLMAPLGRDDDGVSLSNATKDEACLEI